MGENSGTLRGAAGIGYRAGFLAAWRRRVPLGIVCGLVTCALWGLTFIAARAVEPFSAVDLTMLRYGSFGLASASVLLIPRFRPDRRLLRHLPLGFAIGCTGYVGYFLCVAHSVKLAGPSLAPLVVGAMPVLAALLGNWRERAVRWRALLPPLVLIAAGIGVVNLSLLQGASPAGREAVLTGGLLAGLALAIWVVYGLINAAVMRSVTAPDALHWTAVQGVGAAAGSLLLLPLSTFREVAAAHPSAVAAFVGWGLAMGLAGSFLAGWLWAFASKRLPLALSAQLIVTETLFGLIFGFAFEGRWPTGAEWTGAALMVAGVSAGISAFRPRPPAPAPA
jgi:drug/metabolite transporter (DMT)-like permease